MINFHDVQEYYDLYECIKGSAHVHFYVGHVPYGQK